MGVFKAQCRPLMGEVRMVTLQVSSGQSSESDLLTH